MPEDDQEEQFPELDIPWKRMCVISDDMMDRKVCDRAFPYRWQSSVAVFEYRLPEGEQVLDDLIISYLKVTATITGFQTAVDDDEWHLIKEVVGEPYSTTSRSELEDVLLRYYPCYGALLEVSVAPKGASHSTPLADYPYFVDVSPKKRELYELVTETGETLSRSVDEVGVHRGTTTAVGTEVVDADKGVDLTPLLQAGGAVLGGAATGGSPLGMAAGAAGGGLVAGLLGGSDSPTKNLNQVQQTNVVTSERLRELARRNVRSTSLSQMYHQFTAYHVGTNRAVFLMLPRPHVVQSTHTFVNGPRVMEGMQEVLLVVARPRAVKDICVEVNLETAHLAMHESVYDWMTKDVSLVVPEKHWSTDDREEYEKEVLKAFVAGKAETVHVDAGYELDLDHKEGGGKGWIAQPYPTGEIGPPQGTLIGFEVTPAPGTVHAPYLVSLHGKPVKAEITVTEGPESDSLVVTGRVGLFLGWEVKSPGWSRFHYLSGRLTALVTLFLRRKGQEPKDKVTHVFFTSRGGCCCEPSEPRTAVFGGTMVAETAFDAAVEFASARGMRISDGNRLGAEVGRLFLRSLNSPHRYRRGVVRFVESQIVADRVARRLDRRDHPGNGHVADIEGLRRDVRDKVATAARGLRRSDLLRMTLAETSDRFGLDEEEMLHLRRAALGLEAPPPDRRERWDPPSARGLRPVPNVVGESLDAARSTLERRAGLTLGPVRRQDSAQPTDTVLSQVPVAGELVSSETPVELVVATGLVVSIPDVVGHTLTAALCMLRDAGLTSEPEVRFRRSRSAPRHQVLEVTPAPRTYVTPNHEVVLQVADRPPRAE